jgi:hypothetical protein
MRGRCASGGERLRVKLIAIGVMLAAGAVSAGSFAATSTPAGGKIYIHGTGSNGPAGTIVIVGAIGDHGKTLQMDKNGKPDSNGNFVRITLQKGSFEVDTTTLNRISNKQSPAIVDKATCSFLFTATGPVAFSHGTGAYAGIKGTAAITLTFGGIGPLYTSGAHKGQCNMSNNASPVAQYASVAGPGTVSFA